MKFLRLIRAHSTASKWNQPQGKVDTGIKIYNCVAKEKVPLILRDNLYVSFYTCGPTVYDSAHIGHASCYVKLDILQRILRDYFGYNLVTAMNITDIDDKIIKRAGENKTNWKDLAVKYEDEFWNDLKNLNCKEPDIKLRVTEHIPEIMDFISKLLHNNQAYKTPDGYVYFRTKNLERYGKLQKLNIEDEKTDSKENISDFALWKGAKTGEPFWEAEFGAGRPGWHIECSTLASMIFGQRIDFHAGGLDLKFPHHENEEAQSCAFHGIDDWVSYWVHTGHLHLEGQADKMSKSLKNTINISELLAKYSADEFRMACLLSNYKTSIEFGENSMKIAINVLKKLNSFFNDAESYIKGIKPIVDLNESEILAKIENVDQNFEEALKDDFNTSKSVSCLLDLASFVNKSISNPSKPNDLIMASNFGPVRSAVNLISKRLGIFGLGDMGKAGQKSNDLVNLGKLEDLIENIIITRNEIRLKAMETKDKNLFKVCDQIRDNLRKSNVEIKDHKKTSTWNFIKS